MMKELKTLRSGEPACQKRSDADHLRFVIHRRKNELKFDFTIELDGMKSWVVPEVPSMNPLELRPVKEDKIERDRNCEISLDEAVAEKVLRTWDKGNYIPIDDEGKILSEDEALQCLAQGILKFFLQGKKLVGEFVLLKKEKNNWLLMKRHDEFALYNHYSYELLEG